MYPHTWNDHGNRQAVITISVVLILAISAIFMPRPAQAACAFKYTVQAGDTLFAISIKYNVALTALAEANNLKEPYTIYVGQVLCIPAGAEIPVTTPGVEGTPSAAKKVPTIAGIHMGRIAWVGVSNFNANRFYYVNVYAGGWAHWSYPKTTIGYVQTDSKGTFGYWFKLPTEYDFIRTVTFCVKDAINDDVLACQIVTNNDYWYGRKGGW